MARKSVEYNTDTMYNIIHIHRLLVEHRSYLDNLIYQYVHVCTITCNFDTKLSEIQHRSKRSNNYYILMTCTHWNTFKHIADKGTGWKVGAVKKNLPFKNIFDKSTSIVLFELSTGLLYQIWGTDVRKSWSLCHSGSRLIVSLVLNWYAVERLAIHISSYLSPTVSKQEPFKWKWYIHISYIIKELLDWYWWIFALVGFKMHSKSRVHFYSQLVPIFTNISSITLYYNATLDQFSGLLATITNTCKMTIHQVEFYLLSITMKKLWNMK